MFLSENPRYSFEEVLCRQSTVLAAFVLLCLFFSSSFLPGRACVSTVPGGQPIACCPLLTQTISNSTQFADGNMTFTYDNINCPTNVVINCTEPDLTLQLNAAIVANSVNFLSVGSLSTTFPGTCNAQGQWIVGEPPLVVNDLECLLTNPI
uniref:C6 domain-containing protein n=1 Tax=Meloidogyne hapla TaxID=6305 RepID=A0A1I8AY15_MELHA